MNESRTNYGRERSNGFATDWEAVQKCLYEEVEDDVFVVLDCCYAGFRGWDKNIPSEGGRLMDVMVAATKRAKSPAPGDIGAFTPVFLRHLQKTIDDKGSVTTMQLKEALSRSRETFLDPGLLRAFTNDRSKFIRLSRVEAEPSSLWLSLPMKLRRSVCTGPSIGDDFIQWLRNSPWAVKAYGRPEVLDISIDSFIPESGHNSIISAGPTVVSTELATATKPAVLGSSHRGEEAAVDQSLTCEDTFSLIANSNAVAKASRSSVESSGDEQLADPADVAVPYAREVSSVLGSSPNPQPPAALQTQATQSKRRRWSQIAAVVVVVTALCISRPWVLRDDDSSAAASTQTPEDTIISLVREVLWSVRGIFVLVVVTIAIAAGRY